MYNQVLRLHAQILAQGDETQARCQRTVLSINKHRDVLYNKANPIVQRNRTTPYGRLCGGSHLRSGNITMDYAMGADWSKNTVVEGFMNRTLSTAAKTFTCPGAVKDVRDGKVEHPMQYVPVTMAGDGKPVIAAKKMGIASWPNKLWKLIPKVSSTRGVTGSNIAPGSTDAHIQSVWGVRAENGGFHGIIKGTELHGLLYGHKSVTSHGYNGGQGFLPSEGRCGYYTSLSNPDRPHAQTGNKIAAFIYDAYDAYEEQHQGRKKHATVDRTYCPCRSRQTRATCDFFFEGAH